MIVFQPIMDLNSRRIIGYEALSRFVSDPYRPPNEWFDDAHRVGMGVDLELASIRMALAALDLLPSDVYVSVNVSPATAVSPRLHAILATAPAGRVALEITEHDRVEDYRALEDALDEFRRLGVRIAIDDVGAGFSSLAHVFRLRPDVIKLDHSLVRGMRTNPCCGGLVEMLAACAVKAGLQLVAEGIESSDDLDALRRAGVRLGQGYFLGRPAPIDTGQGSATGGLESAA